MPHWLLPSILIALCLLPACGAREETQGRQKRPPNLVIVLADDMGIGDPACYNARSKIVTPNIDKLAKQGMRFTDMHSPSAVCSPTRYGMLTGRYAWRGVLKKSVCFGYDPLIVEPGRLTLAALLKQLIRRPAHAGRHQTRRQAQGSRAAAGSYRSRATDAAQRRSADPARWASPATRSTWSRTS